MKKYLLVDDNNFSLSLTEELISQASDEKDIGFVLANDGISALAEDSSFIGSEEKELLTGYIQKPLSIEKFKNTLAKIEDK